AQWRGIDRWRSFDVALQTVAPSLRFTSVALLLGAAGEMMLAPILPAGTRRLLRLVPTRYALGLGAAGWLAALPGLRRFRAPPLAWVCHLLEPAYLLMSIPLAASSFFRRDWRRTPHGAG